MDGDHRSGLDKRRDDAARAAWLSFVGGRTQDEIAQQMSLSRQAVQRLVAFAVSEQLVKFRIDHRIAACMDLAKRLEDAYQLDFAEVSPTDQAREASRMGVAIIAAERLERLLTTKDPVVVGVGTGRTMRAAVEQLSPLDRPQHKVLSLVGNISAGGAASSYDVVMRLGDRLNAERFPLPAPVLAETEEDRAAFHRRRFFATLTELRARADAIYVGVGSIAADAPLREDGFITADDLDELLAHGAVGEIVARAFDADGRLIDCPVMRRVAGIPLETPPQRQTVVVASGLKKRAALAAALRGGLCTAVIVDEALAEALIAAP